MNKEKKKKENLFLGIGVLAILSFVIIIAFLSNRSFAAGIVDSGTCGSAVWELDSDGCLNISGEGSIGFYSPGNAPWYDIRENIVSVIIESGVTTIGHYAFYQCNSMIEVSLPDTVTWIGRGAFQDCESLISVFLPDSVGMLWEEAFCNCVSLTEVHLPTNLDSIESYMFGNCSSLTNVTLPNSLTNIMIGAFIGCSSLSDITFPDSLTSIEGLAFADCSSLTSIVFPDSITTIGSSAFCDCYGLTDITLPSGLTSIENDAFIGCASLTDIIIPNSTTEIGSFAFEYCINLKTVTLPEQLQTIGDSSFCMCSSLTSISIPEGTMQIGRDAFSNCINLTDVYYDGTEEQWEALSRNAGFGEINLFTNNEQDDELTVSISTRDADGGKAVSMYVSEGSIYYTLDGSVPCSTSLLYQDEFLIDTAGSHIINAKAISEDNNVGGITSMDLFIEQSAVPQIEAIGNHVYILPSDNVHYTLDLSGTPDTLYTEALEWNENLFIKAQVVETGKAKSEVVGCYFQKAESGFVYGKDSYSFSNERQSFGYPAGNYYIPESQMINLFGFHAARLLLDDMAEADVSVGAWGGSCFGMCVTSLMFSRGNLSLANYTETPISVYGLHAPGFPNSLLTRLIERYQLSQFAHAVDQERNDHYIENGFGNGKDIEDFVATLGNIMDGDDPDAAVLVLYGNNDNVHAVVPYRLEQDNEGNSQIYIYDPDFPEQVEGDNVVRVEKRMSSNGKTWYHFEYQNPAYVKYAKAISYNRLSTVLDKLDQVRSYNAFGILFEEQQESSMMLSLNTENFQILDETGNEISGYSLLNTMNSLLPERTILSFMEGTYTIRNLDVSKERLSIGLADTREYYRAEIGDATANVKIGFQFGHLYMEVTANDNTDIIFYIYDENGVMSTISVNASYFRIYAAMDQTILVDSSAPTVCVNGQTVDLMLNEDKEIFMGAAIKRKEEKAMGAYAQETVTMAADIGQILEQTYSLNVEVKNAGENAVVYTACYDEQGQMTSLKYADIQTGKTKYPFTIENSPDMVKVFLLDKTGYRPLLEPIVIH